MSEKKTSNNREVIVMMDDRELKFEIGLADYNNCINKMQQKNKVQPIHMFLISCAADDDTKAAVKECYEDALTMDLFGEVLEGYKPKVEFTVKK
ncbi:putative phage tail assembly chaperone [Endozoicomonas lisbonensis]|uniref:Phage protein n=1 Tax=Endozoicomonas lisbonensis TaxID=3120522 RepID=A0ABV2SJ86_9GAMM